MFSSLVIAIDGYSSCGKSTVAKALARKLGLHYIDSGAMYRAVTLYFLRNHIPFPGENEEVDPSLNYEKILDKVHISFRFNPENGFSEVYLNDQNVELEIRSMEISENVSHVSAIREVRKRLVNLQQMATREGGLVMDGRDIGTTVFPDADLKIFMKADPMVRAERRFLEMQTKGIDVSREEIINNIMSRDYEDTHREISPLRKAEDAIVLDNTWLNQEEQVHFVLNELEKKKHSVKLQ
jgi:cytidylate kinase